MKKVWVLLLLCLMICGCEAKRDEPVESVKPDVQSTLKPDETAKPDVQVTPEPDIESEDAIEDSSAELGEQTEMVEEVLFWDGVMQASYIEETEVNPTTLSFYLDGTVDANLNVCSGMAVLYGKYTKEDNTVVLELKDSGYDFLEDVQFTFNIIEDKLVLDEMSDMFSCSGIDSYVLRTVEE